VTADLSSLAPVRILVVDDHAIFREGVKLLIHRDPQLRVIAEAGNAADALALAIREQPDIVLLDADLAGFDGLEIVDGLRAAVPDTGIIILSGVRTSELRARALRLGAKGFVAKEQSGDVLVLAIRRVRGGELWFDRGTVGTALTRLLHGESLEDGTLARLTPREREIIRLVGEGLKNEAIGNSLAITEKTVRNHLTVIFDKTDVRDRLHLAIYGYRNGLAKLPE
jgi:DNA-binding NarL/FixJ family response regulator